MHGSHSNQHHFFQLNGPKREGIQGKHPLIAVVGPCASGKSTLVKALQERGYNAREVTQEHSYVKTMWQRMTRPDLLIYLDVSQEVAGRRRAAEADVAWWRELERRLRHARQHADLRIKTDDFSPEEVLDRALSFLEQHAS
jgi:thymidylate kinase